MEKSKGAGSKGSIIATVLIVVVVVAAYAAWRLLGATSSADYALVTDADGVEYTLPLDEDQTLTVSTDLGTNVVVVEDGGVCVSKADCPNQDCVETGVVDQVGEQIICLPHELVVEVKSEDEEPEYDVVGR